jgi:RND family efflux transporter MFP subunit
MRPPAVSNRVRLLSLAIRFVVGLLILAVALGVAGLLVANRRQAHQSPHEERILRVRAVEVRARPAEETSRTWEGFGTVRARLHADLAAEVGGRVIHRPEHIDPGVAVAAGELLLQIEAEDYRERMEAAERAAEALEAQLSGLGVEEQRLGEQIEEAQEQIRLAEWEMAQLEQAMAGAASSQIEMVRLRGSLSRLQTERSRLRQQAEMLPSRRAALRAEIAARRNDAEVARRQLERTRVAAPFAGVLQTFEANIGEMVQAGQRIARLVDLSRIEIPLRIPASAQGDVRLGDTATVRTAGGPRDGAWPARVARIAPEADPQTRTVTVFLEVEQPAPSAGTSLAASTSLLMPGRFVRADLRGEAGAGEPLIVIPRRAISDDWTWVAVAAEGGAVRAQPRQVRVLYHIEARFPELEASETQWAVIGEGLAAGERVIVTNLDELAPGVRVEVVEEAGTRDARGENGP